MRNQLTSKGSEVATLRVLVVDDTDAIRAMIRRLLEDEQADIVGEATNGQQAITQVEKLQPDLVIMDHNMPILGGVAATSQSSGGGRMWRSSATARRRSPRPKPKCSARARRRASTNCTSTS